MCVMASHKYAFAYIKNVTKSEGGKGKGQRRVSMIWRNEIKLCFNLGQGERRQENEGTNDEDAYEGTL